MKVLVAYGSKREGTAGLADMIAIDLRAHGFDVSVEDADAVTSLDGYDAIVVGGALYASRWHSAARKLVKRFRSELRRREVFFFSSGPLDDSASTAEVPPTRQVRRLMERVGAQEHCTFGGRLRPDAAGFPAAAMAKDHAGDWRDPAAVNHWTAHLARILHDTSVPS